MRDVLLKRIEGLSERLVDILLVRLEEDLASVVESLSSPARDSVDHHHAGSNGLTSPPSDGQPHEPALTPNEQLLADRRDLIEEALGPDIAELLAPVDAQDALRKHGNVRAAAAATGIPKSTFHDLLKKNSQPPPPPSPDAPSIDPPVAQASGSRVTCRLCGYIGGNARGCGRLHPTQSRPTSSPSVPRTLHAKPEAMAARRAAIGDWSRRQPSRPQPDEPEDANPAAGEQWSAAELAEERESAESRKRDGKLPRRSSSYQVEHDAPANGIPSRASVREVGPEDELDFEASA